VLSAILASILWSLNPAIISRYSRDIKPLIFTGLRALIGLLPLITVITFITGLSVEFNPGLLVAVISALLGPGLGDTLYTQAVRLLSGSLAVVISYTYIFIATGLSVLLLGEKSGLTILLGSILAFTGIVVSTGFTSRNGVKNFKGIFYAACAAISWGLGTVLIRIALNYYDFIYLTAMRLLTVGVVFALTGLVIEGKIDENSRRNLLIAAVITGVFGLTIGSLLFTYAIWSIGITATVIATSLTPILSQWTTKIISGEKIQLNIIIGALLVALGIIILYL
jgi:DME family drug/metabolite transporter